MANLSHDPFENKVNAAAQLLSLRRKKASETSEKVTEQRSAYFDKLALLNAGALTFSVTLLSPSSTIAPAHHKFVFILYTAWVLLLIALSGCLVRNISHQSYFYYEVLTSSMESEASLADAERELIEAKSQTPEGMIYADSPDPYDAEREIKIRIANRDAWAAKVKENKPKIDRNWKLTRVSEWVAAIAMTLGFLALIVFAVFKTYLG